MSAKDRRARFVVSVVAVAVALLFVSVDLAGAAGGKPTPKDPQLKVVTLVGQTVTVTTPGVLYDVAFTPSTAVSFTQQPGEVITVSMLATVTSGDASFLFCDLHAGIHVTNVDAADTPIAMKQTVIMAQRGGEWWEMAEASRDLSRTIPAPATATTHTILGKVWMDAPAEEGGDCYGLGVGGQHVDFTVPMRVSIVTMSGT